MKQKREYIVMTAIDLIHENGFYHVSTKEIAKRVGISESLVFKIFPKKSDIIKAVLDQFSLYDRDIYKSALDKNEDPVDAILFFFDKYLLYYENYPAITAVFQVLDLQKGYSDIDNITKEIYLNRLEFIKKLVINAQESGRMDKTKDAEIISDILFSILKGMCAKWRLSDFSFPLQERTDEAIGILLEALVTR